VVVRCVLRRALLNVLLIVLPHGLLHGLPRVPMHLSPSFGGPYRFYIE
jgi:hypothetical protein